MAHIIKGWGFTVGGDFARAAADTPVRLAPSEHAKPGHVIGYIAGNPKSGLSFLRTMPEVRVHVLRQALGGIE